MQEILHGFIIFVLVFNRKNLDYLFKKYFLITSLELIYNWESN